MILRQPNTCEASASLISMMSMSAKRLPDEPVVAAKKSAYRRPNLISWLANIRSRRVLCARCSAMQINLWRVQRGRVRFNCLPKAKKNSLPRLLIFASKLRKMRRGL